MLSMRFIDSLQVHALGMTNMLSRMPPQKATCTVPATAYESLVHHLTLPNEAAAQMCRAKPAASKVADAVCTAEYTTTPSRKQYP